MISITLAISTWSSQHYSSKRSKLRFEIFLKIKIKIKRYQLSRNRGGNSNLGDCMKCHIRAIALGVLNAKFLV